MAGSSASLHEDPERLSETVVDRHRALVSIMEELEAVDWYDQRAHATTDGSLREILAHNRDEEKEHAAMTLEWLRRHDTKLDEHLRTYLFTEADVLSIEQVAEHGGEAGDSARDSLVGDSSLGLGSLKAVIV
jgi:ferritin-like protein